jgi:hypothetical protein
MEIVVIVVVAVLILGLLAARFGISGTMRDNVPEWPDRSHQGTGGNIDAGGGGN